MSVHTPSDLAAQRGEPTYVWNDGQERRLEMIARWTTLKDSRILEAGCGIGAYTSQFRRRYSPHIEGFDIEFERVKEAQDETPHALVAVVEAIPYCSNYFDTVLSHEVIEHVDDDRTAVAEMIRVLKPGGRLVLFCPNRWYPVEQHGIYWKGKYHFGNIPLINYLPDRWRNQLVPHARAYTAHGLRRLFEGQPVRFIHHARIFGGYDNIIRRFPRSGRFVRKILYILEPTPFQFIALSHLLIVEKVD